MATKKRKTSYKPKKGVSTTCRTAGSKLRKSKSSKVKSKAGSKLASKSCGKTKKSTSTAKRKTSTRRKTTAKKSTTKKTPVIISFGSGSLARSAKRSVKKPGLVLSQVSVIANAKYGSDEKIRKIKAKVC